MKIYSNRFELTRPSEKRIYHAPNTIYGIGVRVEKNGEVQEGTIKLFENGVELTPMSTTVDSYLIFQRTAGGEATANVFDCVYTKGDLVQSFRLIDVTTDSTVFDIDQTGGVMDLPIASETILGGIKVGEGLEIEADGKLKVDVEIPTKTSDLENDSGFITEEDIPEIPTKTSELENDSGFITSADVPTKTSDLENDSGFITEDDIPEVPTKTSDLENDSGFITSADVPTKTSDLENDSGFITEDDIPAATASTLGGVKVGEGLEIEADGKMNVTLDNIPTAVLSGTYATDEEFSFTVYTKQA